MWSCSIMPDHVHVVVARHERPIERIVAHLKARATQRMRAEGLDPLAGGAGPDGPLASPWARRGWNVYLNSMEDVRRAVRYVEGNPAKEGKPPQRWSFAASL